MRHALGLLMTMIVACTGKHTRGPGPICGETVIARERVRARPLVQRPLGLPGLALLHASPDGRIVAAVSNRQTLLVDLRTRQLLAVLPERLLAWRDGRTYLADGEGGIVVRDIDPDVSTRKADQIDVAIEIGGRPGWLRRQAKGMALVDKSGNVVNNIATEDPLLQVYSVASQQAAAMRWTRAALDYSRLGSSESIQLSGSRRFLGLRRSRLITQADPVPSLARIEVFDLADAAKKVGHVDVDAQESIVAFRPSDDGHSVLAFLVSAFGNGSRAARVVMLPVAHDGAPAQPAVEIADLGSRAATTWIASTVTASMGPEHAVGQAPELHVAGDRLFVTYGLGPAGAMTITSAYDLRSRSELWSHPGPIVAVDDGQRVLGIANNRLELRDATTGVGAPLEDAAPVLPQTLRFDRGGLWLTAAARWDLRAATFDGQSAAPPEVDEPAPAWFDEDAATSKLLGCAEARCSASVIGRAGDVVVVEVTPHGNDIREYPPQLDIYDSRGKHRISVYAEQMFDAVLLSKDGSILYVLEREPSHMLVGAMSKDDLRRRIVAYSTRDGKEAYVLVDNATAMAIGVDGVLLVGTLAGRLEAYRGQQRIWRTDLAGGEVKRIAIEPGGARIAMAHEDGAIRVLAARDGALLSTLVAYRDGEWVAFTPNGAFTGTAEVEPRIGFLLIEPYRFFALAQLPERFRDAGLVRRRLAGEQVDLAETIAAPPQLERTSARVGGTSAAIHVRAASATRVSEVHAFVEGRPVARQRICASRGDADLEVPLSPGNNRVSVVAFDDRGVSSNQLLYDLPGPTVAAKPSLHYVAIGISQYRHMSADKQLPGASRDATVLAAALGALAGPGQPFARVRGQVLQDDAATPAAIVSALRVLEQIRSDDVAVVLFAGHGYKPHEDARTLLLTGSARLDGSIADHSIGWDAIGRALARIPGRTLVLLDACHSGHVSDPDLALNDELARSLVREHRAGAIVLAASKGRQLSFEGPRARALKPVKVIADRVRVDTLGDNGLFTAAFVRALVDPASDHDGDGTIYTSEIIREVTDRVTTATRAAQTPWIARRELFGDFALARVPRRTSVPACTKSPMRADAIATDVLFRRHVKLTGYRIDASRAKRGGVVGVTLHLEVVRSLGTGFAVDVALSNGVQQQLALTPGLGTCALELQIEIPTGAGLSDRLEARMSIRRGADALEPHVQSVVTSASPTSPPSPELDQQSLLLGQIDVVQ